MPKRPPYDLKSEVVTEEQRKLVAKLTSVIQKEYPEYSKKYYVHNDYIRFLLANSYDYTKSLRKMRNCNNWRIETDMDNQSVLDPKWDEPRSRKVIQFLGFDNKGRPVCYCSFKRHIVKDFDPDYITMYLFLEFDWFIKQMPPHVYQYTLICDYDGFDRSKNFRFS